MLNRELFINDPLATRLLNEGVASVTAAKTSKELDTLRYELRHFVCEGQYQAGIVRILEAYLGALGSGTQPAAWVSGFFGSGKSHLLKMLQHLWVNTTFPDGSTARDLALLPDNVKHLLKELDTYGRRHGGLIAVADKLPAGSRGSVRLIILGMVLRAKGLPDDLAQARFCMWLKRNGTFDDVRAAVEAGGQDFDRELQDLYVSRLIAEAVLKTDPTIADDLTQVRAALRTQYPVEQDISSGEFIGLIREVLSDEGQLPCTLIALDEAQLFIGNSSKLSLDMQEAAEALSKQMDGRVMLIAAGQTALASALPEQQKLVGRFTIPVELSDADVETVTRKVVLAKKINLVKDIEKVLSANAGEIDRQLSGSSIGPRAEDVKDLAADYPLLPARRRLWEEILRAVDKPGTASQLRSQLRIVYEAVRATAEMPLGHVVPADFIFEQQQTMLLQTGVLLREIDETIRKLHHDDEPNGRLAQRLCGMIFLIRKLPREAGSDKGVRATAAMLADLLVSDLANEGTTLRRLVPTILDELVRAGKLIKIEDEYSLQTRESSEWDGEFRTRQSRLMADLTLQSAKRNTLFKSACSQALKGIRLTQGNSRVPREIAPHFGGDKPDSAGRNIPIWIRDEWGEKEGIVIEESRKAGTDSPLVFVHIQMRSPEDLRRAIVDSEAAKLTLDFMGSPASAEGIEARAAMMSRQTAAENTCNTIVRDVIDQAKVFQGGGNEVYESTFAAKLESAARSALLRMFPLFKDADDTHWGEVIRRAKGGDDSPLEALGWKESPEKHPVCSAVLSEIGAGKRGKEIRDRFEESPYGWPRDAVDAALIVLHASGQIRATLKASILGPSQLDQAKIPVTEFRAESAAISAPDKIRLRTLFKKAQVVCKPGEETTRAGEFLTKLSQLAEESGGDAPLPSRPNRLHIEDLRSKAGNEQLAAILDQEELLAQQIVDWMALSDLASKRLPVWETTQFLIQHAASLEKTNELQKQMEAILTERRLLDSPDPVPAIAKSVSATLRSALAAASKDYQAVYDEQLAQLVASANWKQLDAQQRNAILQSEGIAELPKMAVGNEAELKRTLVERPLAAWQTLTLALHQQFAAAALAAAQLLEPKTQSLHLRSETLKTEQDVRTWITITETELLDQIKHGPIVIT